MITKNCPYCNSEMKIGYQYSFYNPVQWIPSGNNPPSIRGRVAKEGVKTGEGNWFIGYTTNSYYCEDCKVIITPIKNK